ncbi:protein AF-10-like isoform X3 [Asterias rubens]|uniref:protein AF-10-like isoform X3 n=1 Tax=Asterias rubens TaxID=7604 RepID=UPI0014550DA0|nr:protein AF-10-like isoform X3 [Asterias rubens]
MKEMIGGCCVCGDERGWTENPLVYCDGQGCNVAVHQACYGIVTVPTGPWYCRKCESQERSARVRCELCPQREGALKRTDNGSWAHVVCALYIPEVCFGNVTTMEPILLSSVPHDRYNKSCCLCETKGREAKAAVGACMTCNKNGCRQSFHVTCAQQDGFLCEEAGQYNDNVKYTGYCSYHYNKLKKDKDIKTIPPFKPLGSAYSTPEKPADRPSADKTEKTDKSEKLKLDKIIKAKPERKNRFCIAEASAALIAQQESAAEARAAEVKAAEARSTDLKTSVRSSEGRVAESKVARPSEGRVAESKAARLSEGRVAESKAARLSEGRVAESKAARLSEGRVAESKAARLAEARAAESKAARLSEGRLAESKAARLAEARAAELKTVRLSEARAAEVKATRLTEACTTEPKSGTNTSSSPNSGKGDDSSGKFTNANFTETVIGPTGTPPSSSGVEDPSSGDSSLILKFTRNTVSQPGRGRKSSTQKLDIPGVGDSQSTVVSSKSGGSEFSVSYSERVSSPSLTQEDTSLSVKPNKSKKGQSKSNPSTPNPTTPMVITETVMVKDLPPVSEKTRGTPTVDVETVTSPTPSGSGKTTYTGAYEEFMAKYKAEETEDVSTKNKEEESSPASTIFQTSKVMTTKPTIHKPTSSKTAISTTSSSGDEMTKRERKKHRSGKRKDSKLNRPRSSLRSFGGGDGIPNKKRRSSGSSLGSPQALSMPRLSFSGTGGSCGLNSPSSGSSMMNFLNQSTNNDSAIRDVFNMAGQSGLIGPQSRLSSLNHRQHQETTQSSGMPETMEQLLERQWDQGSEFLMHQATHLDIASLLSCLYQIRQENTRLEEHLTSLVQRRDHLIAVNLRLARPLHQGGSPENSRRSPRFNNVIHSDGTTMSASSQELNSSRSSTQSLSHSFNQSLNHSYNQSPSSAALSHPHGNPTINLNHSQSSLHPSSTPQNNGLSHLPVMPSPIPSSQSSRHSPAHSHTSTPLSSSSHGTVQVIPGHGQATPPPGRLTPGHGQGRMTPSQERMTPVLVKTSLGQSSSGHGSEGHKRVPSRDSTSTESSHSSRDSTSRDQPTQLLGVNPGVNPAIHPAMLLQHQNLNTLVQQHLTTEQHQQLVYQMMQTQNPGLGLSVVLPPGIGTATTAASLLPVNGELQSMSGHTQSQSTSRPKSPRGERRQTNSKDKS